jgi:hypothetical protein
MDTAEIDAILEEKKTLQGLPPEWQRGLRGRVFSRLAAEIVPMHALFDGLKRTVLMQ